MREWQSLLQVLNVYAVCWTELTQSFLRAFLSVAAFVSFSSPVLRCLVTAPLYCDRSAARCSQDITNIIRKPKRKIYLDITNYNVNTRQKINAEQINSEHIL